MWRACKGELAFESPRLHDWEPRRRLLMLASLAYAFLLELMQPPWEGTRDWIMHFWCHRTGAWTRLTLVPFTRLRTASVSSGARFPLPLSSQGALPWRCAPSLARFGMNHVFVNEMSCAAAGCTAHLIHEKDGGDEET